MARTVALALARVVESQSPSREGAPPGGHLQAAWDLLATAEGADRRDPFSCALAMYVGVRLGRSASELDRLFEKGVALEPAFYPLFEARAVSLLALSGAARGSSEAFAATAGASTRGAPVDEADVLYAVMASAALQALPPQRVRSATRLDEPRLRKGLQDLERRFPRCRTNVTLAALWGVVLQDRELAAACFKNLEGRCAEGFFSPQDFAAAERWATGQGPWPLAAMGPARAPVRASWFGLALSPSSECEPGATPVSPPAMARADPARTGAWPGTPVEFGSGTVRVSDVRSDISPTVWADVVLVAGSDGLEAVDRDSLKLLWTFRGEVPRGLAIAQFPHSGPAVAAGVACYGLGSAFWAVDVRSGRPLWHFAEDKPGLDDRMSTAPVVSEGAVLFATRKAVYSLELATGRVLWRCVPRASGARGGFELYPAVAGDLVCVCHGDTLLGMERVTGKVRWTQDRPGGTVGAGTFIGGDVVVSFDGYRRTVAAFELATGRPRWQAALPCDALETLPAVAAGLLLCSGGPLTALSLRDGRAAWQFSSSSGAACGTPVVVGTTVYVPAGKELHRLSLATGLPQGPPLGASIQRGTCPTVSGERLFFTTPEGQLAVLLPGENAAQSTSAATGVPVHDVQGTTEVGRLEWISGVKGVVAQSAAMTATSVLAVQGSEAVVAVGLADGATVWRTPLTSRWKAEGVVGPSVDVDAGPGAPVAVALTGALLELLALDGATGRQLWRTEVRWSSRPRGEVALLRSSGLLCLSTLEPESGRHYVVFDAATGAERWRNDFPGQVMCRVEGIRPLLCPARRVAVLQADDRHLVGCSLDDGATLWRAELPGSLVATPVALDAGQLLAPWNAAADSSTRVPEFATAAGHTTYGAPLTGFHAIETAAGQSVEVCRILGSVGGDLVPTGRLVAWTYGARDGFTACNLETRRSAFRYAVEVEPSSPVVADDGAFYVSCRDGSLHVLDLVTGRLRFRTRLPGWTNGRFAVRHGLLVYTGAEGNWRAVQFAGHRASTGREVAARTEGARVEARTNSLGMKLSWVPSGRFEMGSSKEEPGRSVVEGPKHEVTIGRGFWLGQCVVTMGELNRLLRDEGLATHLPYEPPVKPNGAAIDCERFPACVPWGVAELFCRKLTARDVSSGLAPSGSVYRLPSEAEWEYACRAGSTTATYAGPLSMVRAFHSPVLDAIAWYGGNSVYRDGCGLDLQSHWRSYLEEERARKYKHLAWVVVGVADCPATWNGFQEVGLKQPNAWGLYDMLGNARQWTLDTWHESYDGAPTDGRAWTDGGDPSERVVRGVFYSAMARTCRSAQRSHATAQDYQGAIGFRVLLSGPDPR